MSQVNDEIAKVFRAWGKDCALELKEEADAALRAAGRKNPQSISLEFDETIKTTPDGDVSLEIRAVKKGQKALYWRAIEEGRKAGKRQPPSNVFGKTWQNEQNIDAREVLLKIEAKRRNGIKGRDRKLDYDKSVKALSFIIARSIGRKGIKPKPFLGKVITEERIADLRTKLTPLIGKKFKLIITGLE